MRISTANSRVRLYVLGMLIGTALVANLEAQSGAAPNQTGSSVPSRADERRSNPGDGPPGTRQSTSTPANLDWANLKRYQAANAALAPPTVDHPRTVFMGDSITQFWAQQRPQFFGEHGYVGRGIAGQTSSQMLLRFYQDVIALRPATVVILAGTNDVAENTGPMSDEQIIDNLAAMTDIAHANHIGVVIGSVPPATRFFWRPDMTPASRIKALDVKIKSWARDHHLAYADFWAAMSQSDGSMKEDLASDTVHPNGAGYEVMEPIIQMAIVQALQSQSGLR